MKDVKWIKLSSDIFNNRKIRQLQKLPDGYAIIVMWIKLLCLAGQVNDSGLVYITPEVPYTEEMLATEFELPVQTVRFALGIFQQFGMVDLTDNIYHVSSWEKYQNQVTDEFCEDQEDRKRAKTAARVAAYRERKKIENHDVTLCNADVTPESVTCNAECNADVTLCNALQENKEETNERNEEKAEEKEVKRDSLGENKEHYVRACARGVYGYGFEDLWNDYPRKIDKGYAYKAYVARLNEGWSEEDLRKAVTNYVAECRREHTETRYVKHLSTFFSAALPFTDYLPKKKSVEEDPESILRGMLVEENPFG